MNQFIDSFVDQMNIVHQKLQIDEPLNESYPGIDLNEKCIINGTGGTTKDKKELPPSKLERGKSPKKSPAPSQDSSAVSKRAAISGTISQIIVLISVPRQITPSQTSLIQSLLTLHFKPSSHFGHNAPPQSSSVSGPFSVLSLQVGAKNDVPRQITPSQTSLIQSLLSLHFKPSSHLGHNAPPQSSSVSGPLSVLSLQVGAENDVPRQITPSQTSLIQSLLTLHFKPSSHFGHNPPPQSSSVSGPFSVLSLQLLISVPRQITPSQTSLIQSLLTLHFKPSSHFGHNPPPQSSSVSCPFTVLSTQVAAKIEDELYYFTFS
ncbi:unnamed protein product [Rotaria sordida]|uniref:Uncharacterized protein n=1 Tax=Rotaria sordida TaxID=392033 RepID=A0A814U3B9_9BILA|nr:unnamed protein product [Rotaria sordida]